MVGTPEQVLAYRDLGFTFLGCSSDSGLLAVGARQLAGRLLALKTKPTSTGSRKARRGRHEDVRGRRVGRRRERGLGIDGRGRGSVDHGLGDPVSVVQEIEVAAQVRLHDVADKQLAVAAQRSRGRGL